MRLNPGTLTVYARQALRAGLSVDVPVSSSDTAVGTFTNLVAFETNQSLVYGYFDPLTAGAADLTITQPPGFDVPANGDIIITAGVRAPYIYFAGQNVYNRTVGEDLQQSISVTLEEIPPDPVDVEITSSAGAISTITIDGTRSFAFISSKSFVPGRGVRT